MLDNITVFHNSIKIAGQKNIYFDPFKIIEENHDADVIFITHDHFDHYSFEDINKIIKDDTILIAPESMKSKVEKDFNNQKLFVTPNEEYDLSSFNMADISFTAIPAYNIGKPFHPKSNKWVGYLVVIEGTTYYIAGDTDATEDAKKVKCDVAFIPCGGMYTMNYKEGAELTNIINPKIVVPVHYGSVAGSLEEGEKLIKLLLPSIQGVIKIK